MALINCPECGKQVSDKASSCPNCGYPIGIEVTTVLEQTSTVEIQVKDKNGKTKKMLPLIICIVVVAIIGIVIYSIKENKIIDAQNKEIYDNVVNLLGTGSYKDMNEINGILQNLVYRNGNEVVLIRYEKQHDFDDSTTAYAMFIFNGDYYEYAAGKNTLDKYEIDVDNEQQAYEVINDIWDVYKTGGYLEYLKNNGHDVDIEKIEQIINDKKYVYIN